jgi:hypothetical protein
MRFPALSFPWPAAQRPARPAGGNNRQGRSGTARRVARRGRSSLPTWKEYRSAPAARRTEGHQPAALRSTCKTRSPEDRGYHCSPTTQAGLDAHSLAQV